MLVMIQETLIKTAKRPLPDQEGSCFASAI